jgi:hypothetical protein
MWFHFALERVGLVEVQQADILARSIVVIRGEPIAHILQLHPKHLVLM